MNEKKEKIQKAAWYPYAVAACIAVLLYVFLTNAPAIWVGLRKVFGYFKAVFLGCILAYMINPIANMFRKKVFFRIKSEKKRTQLSNLLAFILLLLFVTFSIVILIPQLIASVQLFAGNLDGYIAAVEQMLDQWGLSESLSGVYNLVDSSESMRETITDFLENNLSTILTTSATAGKSVFTVVIAFIMSIYVLAEKDSLLNGIRRLLHAVASDRRYAGISTYLHKCDSIFNRYIVFNLIDSLIVGTLNAVFMTICRMQYVGLISMIAAITNLIPTFGPVIGFVLGGFILLMVNPVHALIFLIFTLVLQTLDGYVIKPKLFGTSLGVSGLWILIGVIVGGNMFGVVGILLAIPVVAILDLTYSSYFLPWLENRRKTADSSAAVGEEET